MILRSLLIVAIPLISRSLRIVATPYRKCHAVWSLMSTQDSLVVSHIRIESCALTNGVMPHETVMSRIWPMIVDYSIPTTADVTRSHTWWVHKRNGSRRTHGLSHVAHTIWSHVANTNWVMSLLWVMSRIWPTIVDDIIPTTANVTLSHTWWVHKRNESRRTCELSHVARTIWAMSHVWPSIVDDSMPTTANITQSHTWWAQKCEESCRIYEWGMSHIWIESCRTYKVIHVAYTNESCRI